MTGEILRSYDWAATPLGLPGTWPQPLKTLVAVMLGSNQPMFVAWGEQHTLLYNDAYSEILASKHPALGQPFLKVWSEISSDLIPIVDQAYAGRAVHMDDITLMISRKGYVEEAHFAFSYTPVRGEDGEVRGFFCPCTETTAQVEAERKLSESEARLRDVLDRMGEGFILLDDDFRVIDINAEGMRLETRSRGDIMGRTHWEAWPGTEESELGRIYKRAIAERRPVALEHRYVWQNGQDALLDMRAYPVGAGLAIFYRDVTERRKSEHMAREAAERIELALNSGAILGTWVWDVRNDRFVADQRFAHSFGADPIRCQAGLPLEELFVSIHPEDREQVAEAVSDALSRGGPYRCEYRVRGDNDDYRWIEANGRVEVGADGKPLRFPGVIVDIDDRRRAEEALREREGQLSAYIAQSTAGFAEVDATGRFTLVNDRFCELTGRSREELMSITMQSITHPDDLPANVSKFQRALAEGTPFVLDKRYIRPDGSAIWVNNSVSVIRRPSGEPYGLLAVSIDVTEQRNAEASVRENEARLRALTDNLPAGMVYQVATGADGAERRFQFVSQSCEKLTGYPAEAFVADASTAYRMILPEDRALLAEAEAVAIEMGAPLDVQVRFRRADGEVRWGRIISEPRQGPDGSLIWDGIKIDISELKEAEALLRDMNATLEQKVAERTAERDRAWRNTQDLLVTVGPDGSLLAVNPAWTKVLGYSEAETAGRHFVEFIHPDDVERTTEAVADALEGPIDPVENRYRAKDGSYRWISWIGASDGDVIYASGRDITPQKQTADELAEAQEALRQSQKMEAMGQLTGGVAHDFNNVLTPIIGALDFLQHNEERSSREQRLIEGALQSAERARTLVERLLAFARRQPLRATAVEVPTLIAGMVDLIDSTTGPNIRIETQIPPDLPPIVADGNQLEMAILNLAVNSRDAMPQGGIITVSAAVETPPTSEHQQLGGGDYVRITIEDTGVGMDEETLSRAVEPFFSTKGVGRGTGLGLSMVHGLTAQLGGALTLSSSVGKGTRADIWLPTAAEGLANERPSTTVSAASVLPGTVLLVDDEALVRTSTAEMLADLGCRVVQAESAAEALHKLPTQEIDLIITDHLMPGMSGTELAEKVSELGGDIPVLIISGYANLDGLPAKYERLTKPFRRSDLAAALERISIRAPASA